MTNLKEKLNGIMKEEDTNIIMNSEQKEPTVVDETSESDNFKFKEMKLTKNIDEIRTEEFNDYANEADNEKSTDSSISPPSSITDETIKGPILNETINEQLNVLEKMEEKKVDKVPQEWLCVNIPMEFLKVCDVLKNIGNKYFKEDDFVTPIKYYSAAIHLINTAFDESGNDPDFPKKVNASNIEEFISIDQFQRDLFDELYRNSTVTKEGIMTKTNTDLHIYYTNRSFCHAKLESYGLSLEDIEEAIKINPQYAKAYYRRGCCYLLLSNLKEAVDSFQKVLKLCKDRNSEIKLKECKKLLFEQEFQKAIEMELKLPFYETINLDSMELECLDAPIYDKNNLNVDFLKRVAEYISVPEQKLNKKCVCAIILDAIKLLKEVPTLVYIDLKEEETLTICGDIHGQYYDLLNIMNINGYPSETNSYLFNGDFVDRGSFSVEVIVFLLLAKLTFPKNVYLTRGNHETDNMNRIYGFLGELMAKYDEKMHSLFSDCFKLLPLAYVLNQKVFICHGGIPSKENITLKEIRNIDRNTEPLDMGVMTDLLWADPSEELGLKPSKRGIGYSFGVDITQSFLKNNNLSLVIRSHEVRNEGFALEQQGMLYTVFSAPNYCDLMKNKGAFLKFKGNSITPECVTFTEAPHPNIPSLRYAHNLYQAM